MPQQNMSRKSIQVADTNRTKCAVEVLQEWGALVFESRRFVELRKQTFWTQFLSNESFGMGVFYTLNVFCIQARHCRHPAHALPSMLLSHLLAVMSLPGKECPSVRRSCAVAARDFHTLLAWQAAGNPCLGSSV